MTNTTSCGLKAHKGGKGVGVGAGAADEKDVEKIDADALVGATDADDATAGEAEDTGAKVDEENTMLEDAETSTDDAKIADADVGVAVEDGEGNAELLSTEAALELTEILLEKASDDEGSGGMSDGDGDSDLVDDRSTTDDAPVDADGDGDGKADDEKLLASPALEVALVTGPTEEVGDGVGAAVVGCTGGQNSASTSAA
jgi:hypothetical protein